MFFYVWRPNQKGCHEVGVHNKENIYILSMNTYMFILFSRLILIYLKCVRIPLRARCTTLWVKVYQWLTTGRFSPGTLVSSTNKTDRHDITDILLKVALSTINHQLHLKYNRQWQVKNFQLGTGEGSPGGG